MSEVKEIVRLVIIQVRVVLRNFHEASMRCLELDVHKVNLPNLVTTQVVRRLILG